MRTHSQQCSCEPTGRERCPYARLLLKVGESPGLEKAPSSTSVDPAASEIYQKVRCE